jgi:serine/threonine-protein kinase RsbW
MAADSLTRASSEERGTLVATTDEVRLTVPAMPEFLRLTRVTAAGLASRLGFSFDEVEDLRLAIDELCYGLTGSTGQPGTMHVRYVLGADSLIVEGEGRFDVEPVAAGRVTAPPQLSELSEVILNALVDEHELGAGEHGPTFRLVKRRHQQDDG